MVDMPQSCTLCNTLIKQKGSIHQEPIFCCEGCHAVYQILFSQNALNDFHNHPLFLQAVRSGLISNPDLIEQIRQKSAENDQEDYQKFHLEIQDMWCPSCAQVIALILMQEKGIRHCVVDYSTDLASIEFSPLRISQEKIFQLIKKMGYRPIPLQDFGQRSANISLYVRFIVAAFCAANIMMFTYPIYASYFYEDSAGYANLFAWLSLLSSIPVLTYSAWPIWRRFVSAFRAGIWGMETLVLMGVSAAFSLSVYELFVGSNYVYFDSMSVIIAFVLLGKIIETRAKFSAKDALIRLTRALPRRGRKRFSDGSEAFVPLKEIVVNDTIVALSGEKIVLDGSVIEGEGACDESVMTGEAIPVYKKAGSKVLAGSFLQKGRMVIQVTADLAETALNRILLMVEQDIGHKSYVVRVTDKVVKWFVPLVIVLAGLTAFYCWVTATQDGGLSVMQTAIIRAVSVLLISCPCAIGIAAPLVESHILNSLAKRGALVRNRGCLEFLGRETLFVFDKTGTLTEGKFSVYKGLESLNFELQTILKGLVIYSNHPIAAAINQSLLCYPAPLRDVEEVVGRGMQGWKDDNRYLLGSASFLREQQVEMSFDAIVNEEIQSEVYFAKNHVCVTKIHLRDSVKAQACALIKVLHPSQTWLLSGDAPTAVKAVANQVGCQNWEGQCTPFQKKARVEQFRQEGHIVAAIGDGINDAPALAASHVGIAVVNATDISIQVADILLTSHNLETILWIQKIAQKGRKIIKQNLFWAFFYNVVGIALAMCGLLTPLFSAFAMVLSSFIVLFNAQRIR